MSVIVATLRKQDNRSNSYGVSLLYIVDKGHENYYVQRLSCLSRMTLLLQYYVNDSKVIHGNIPCTDGIIHIVSKLFVSKQSYMHKAESSTPFPTAIVLAVVGAAVCVCIVGAVVILLYRKTQSGSWKIIEDWRANRRV